MVEPSAVFAFLGAAFKFSEYAVRLYDVDSEQAIFVRTIQRVRRDLEETERLLCMPSIERHLISIPGKLGWIQEALKSTKNALNEVGRFVENARVDTDLHGTVQWDTRVKWVFKDNSKAVMMRGAELSTCHQSLSTVLAYLMLLERMDVPAESHPPSYDATFLDDSLSPSQKRKNAQLEGTQYQNLDSRPSWKHTSTNNDVCVDQYATAVRETLIPQSASSLSLPTQNRTSECSQPPSMSISQLNDEKTCPAISNSTSSLITPTSPSVSRSIADGNLYVQPNEEVISNDSSLAPIPRPQRLPYQTTLSSDAHHLSGDGEVESLSSSSSRIPKSALELRRARQMIILDMDFNDYAN